ncbi:MAG: hypothetical protein ACOYN3_05820 [Acidimicrobiia bacterium]
MQPDEPDLGADEAASKRVGAMQSPFRRVLESVAKVELLERQALKRVLPTMVASGVMQRTPWPVVQAVGTGLFLGSGLTLGASYADVAARSRELKRREQRAVRNGQYKSAMLYCAARSVSLGYLPNGRRRAATAALRVIEYAARTGDPLELRSACELATLGIKDHSLPRSRNVEAVLHRSCEIISEWDDVLSRVVARHSLLKFMHAVNSNHIGLALVDLGTDLYRSAELFTGTLAISDIEAEILQTVAGMTLGRTDVVGWALDQAGEELRDGLAYELIRAGAPQADCVARRLIEEQVVPPGIVFAAYANAMDVSHDPRATVFRSVVDRANGDYTAALALIGVARPTPGMGPISRT